MTEQNKRLIELMKQTGTVDEKTLQEHLKKLYYESGNSPITDVEYDELFGDKDYVGYQVEQNGPWQVLPHKIPMGSLTKLTSWKQAEDWLKDKGKVLWEPKLDGLSMELVYENGILIHAILRGGGTEGEDVLKNAQNFQYVPHKLENASTYVSVRGEVVIAQSAFTQLCQTQGAEYSNRRNCVPGICRRYDGKYSDFLSFWAYDIIERNSLDESKECFSELEKLTTLYTYGFKIPFAFNVLYEKDYENYASMRDAAEEFQMDGLVIKTMDMQYQIALKFQANGDITTVADYTWDVGSTGKLVPVVHFEPVKIGGSTLTKASVGSYKLYKELNAPIGSKVKVKKMNDVIPKVTEVIEQSSETLEIPKVCPVCGEPLKEQGADLYCVNSHCSVKIEGKCTAVYWAACIKGVTDKWVKELIKRQIINEPADVLKVTPEDIASIDGYSLNKGKQIVEYIHTYYKDAYKNNDVRVILNALAIPTIGGKALDKLVDYFETYDYFEDTVKLMSKDDLLDDKKKFIDCLGNAKGSKVFEYLLENRQDILNLLKSIKEI